MIKKRIGYKLLEDIPLTLVHFLGIVGRKWSIPFMTRQITRVQNLVLSSCLLNLILLLFLIFKKKCFLVFSLFEHNAIVVFIEGEQSHFASLNPMDFLIRS